MYTKAHSVHRNMEEGEVPPNPLVKQGQALTVHRGPGASAPPKPSTCPSRWGERGTGRGTAIGVPDNAFTFYIYFTNGNRSVKADFSFKKSKFY